MDSPPRRLRGVNVLGSFIVLHVFFAEPRVKTTDSLYKADRMSDVGTSRPTKRDGSSRS